MSEPEPLSADDWQECLKELLAKLSLAEKVSLLTGADYWSFRAHQGIGLRPIVMSDGPAGVRGQRWDERDPALNVPAPVALAATWDPKRAELIGRLLAAECRRKNVDMLLAPTINLQRSPYGGRNFEYFSEDPLLTAAMGSALVRGLQSAGVAATVKHFVANDSETDRFAVDAQVGERALRELYLAPFESIIRDARPWAVMAAYNSVNGHTMTESPMLSGILKGEWGFDGLVVSDWHAGRSTEATANAGLDLMMPGPAGPWGRALIDAVQQGLVGEAAVDDKVIRLLRLAARAGALAGTEPAESAEEPWTSQRAREALRSTAASGFVLVRNERSLLPLDPQDLRRVAVIGLNAAIPRTLGGGSATVFPPYSVSPLEGLRAALAPEVLVSYSPGVRTNTRIPLARPALLHLRGSTEPGTMVEFVDATGSVLHAEHRLGGLYLWRTLPEAVTPAELASVRVTTAVRAQTSGRHIIGCSGHGRFRITLAGKLACETHLSVPAGTDPTAAYVRPPQLPTAVSLVAGQSVDLVLEHYPDASGGDTSFALGGVAFQLNVEEPRAADSEEIAAAVRLAQAADVAIVVVGTTEEVESEGCDRVSLDLPGQQDELVRRVADANPRTAVVVNSGSPVLLPWADSVPAVLLTSFPGQEYGDALADVLLGRSEPGGRLPTTWPDSPDHLPATTPSGGVLTYSEGLHIGYRHFDRAGREPRYPFGYGLGYTKWEYLDADVVETPSARGGAVIRVRVRNAGARFGRETIQVYASHRASSFERPVRWLVGFANAEAGPDAELITDIPVPLRGLAHWSTSARAWAVEPGSYQLAIGRSSRDLPLTTEVIIGPGTDVV
jgi:beta-glucosidase